MKKYVSFIAILLCTLVINTKSITANTKVNGNPAECSCCKKCNDPKCKELCKKWCGMSDEEKSSAEGQKVKEECMKRCKESKCGSTDCMTASSCGGSADAKGCCKKK
ncbi:MAG TPA: hypothetical protein VFF27_16690 [Bacteroidia bacterium]|nr:hypothetical protein [Bacteroidia bacterium]